MNGYFIVAKLANLIDFSPRIFTYAYLVSSKEKDRNSCPNFGVHINL